MKNIIKKVEVRDANFFIEKSDFSFLNDFLDRGFSKKSLKVSKSKIFYKNSEGQIVSLITIKDILIFKDQLNKENLLISKGKIFNIPFNFEWKYDENSNEKITKAKINSLKLKILNSSKKKEKIKNLKINFRRSKLNTNYSLKGNSILLESKNSYLGANKLDYDGKINLEPFDFKINTKIDRLNLKSFYQIKLFLKKYYQKNFY